MQAPFKVPLSDLSLEFNLLMDLCAPFPDDLFAQYMSLLREPLLWRHEVREEAILSLGKIAGRLSHE